MNSDVLSLTLPKARGRSWRKRIPKPPRGFWWFMAWCLWSAVWCVVDALTGDYGYAALQLSAVAAYWRMAMRLLAGKQPWSHPAMTAWIATYVAAFLALVVTGS